jgi:ArsR family transcriptional regulator
MAMDQQTLLAEIHILHAQICSGLADPNRIFILYTLHENDYNVSELADTIDLPQSTVSRHLKILRDRGIVKSERRGQSVYYSLSDKRIIQALDILRSVLADNLESRGVLALTVSSSAKE